MQLTAITAALGDIPSLNNRVIVAADLEAALDAVKPFASWPCVAVFGLRESAGKNPMGIGSGPRHLVTVTLRLLALARDVTDTRGHAAMLQLDSLRDDIKAAMLGLVPDSDHTPLEYVGGGLAHAQAGTVAWVDDFTTTYYLTHPPDSP